jgi:hypothetical protein
MTATKYPKVGKAKQASKVLTVLQLAARPSRLESKLSDLSVVDSSKPLPVGSSTAVGQQLSALLRLVGVCPLLRYLWVAM